MFEWETRVVNRTYRVFRRMKWMLFLIDVLSRPFEGRRPVSIPSDEGYRLASIPSYEHIAEGRSPLLRVLPSVYTLF